MIQISTSILSSSNRVESVKKLNNTNTDYLHLDIMDGNFVNNKQFTIAEITKLVDISNKKIDAHFMVDNPISYLKKVSLLNIEYFTFHLEITKDINKLITSIKNYGFKVGISIKPNTNIDELLPYLDKIDLVLIMSVEPGLGGQTFIENSLSKITELKNIIDSNNLSLKIEIDGGINDTNINSIIEKGTDIAVVGSYIINSNNYQEQINKLKK